MEPRLQPPTATLGPVNDEAPADMPGAVICPRCGRRIRLWALNDHLERGDSQCDPPKA